MTDIGSPAWIDAVAASVVGLDAGGTSVSVLHRIEGGPSWIVEADGGDVTVRPAAPDEGADVSFSWQADDAAAVAAGTTTVLAVFGTGRLRVGGDLRRLTEATALFARFPGADT